MEGNNTITGTYQFRGVDYLVTVNVDDGQEKQLTVEVDDQATADQWRGSFDAACKYVCYFQEKYKLFLVQLKSSTTVSRDVMSTNN